MTISAQQRSTRMFFRSFSQLPSHDRAAKNSQLVNKVDKLYVVRGSGAHSKQQGMADETVARELGAARNASGWRSDYRWRIEVGGVLLDVAHARRAPQRAARWSSTPGAHCCRQSTARRLR